MNVRQRVLLTGLLTLASFGSWADIVHVYEQTSVNGQVEVIRDTTVNTGVKFTSLVAPKREGYIFTHWSISTKQAFENRDPWGRAYRYVEFIPYEATILTANYLAETIDTDRDGIADGDEIYWYGTLAKTAGSNTDGDAYTFAQELAYGMNPHFVDEEVKAGVVSAETGRTLYNPYGYRSYTVRCEPEGELFETYTDYVRPGTTVSTITCNRLSTTFAYWSVNGVEQRDEFGRAVNAASFVMPSVDVVVVAHCAADAATRERLYWYGRTDISDTSDTDADGFYFFEELAMGTSPLFPDEHLSGVVSVETEKLLYNPYNYQSYVVRSEPEGALFETITEFVRPGTEVSTKKMDHLNTAFAQWKMNGVRQADEFGRALSQLTFAMPANAVELVAETQADEIQRARYYWYGDPSIALSSDTDRDGYTFADEIAMGTSPLFADESSKAGVVYAAGDADEVNLQVYEQVRGAVVDDKFVELFHSPIAGNASMSFDGAVKPVVADVNGDDMWDIVVCTATATNVYINVGSKGNPEFRRGGVLASSKDVDLNMNSTAKLAVMDLDIKPVNALSATTWKDMLLVSDTEGRIWYYTPSSTPISSLHLNHKVWGGSYPGFAAGLQLAAVDWEDDGDLDCLCGTADGKLMLLRNPKVGRPTNLKASTGVNSVVLRWDPNAQSRIRGYKVYRGTATGSAPAESFESLVSPYTPLPTYRDLPTNLLSDYDYKVSSVSRLYRAGDSTPIVSESIATEPVRVAFGGVTVTVNDAAGFVGEDVEVFVSINNTLGLTGENLMLSLSYDPAVLTPKAVRTTGLTEGLVPQSFVDNGTWDILTVAGNLAPGEGRVFILTFTVAASVEVQKTTLAITQATLRLKDDKASAARVTYVNGTVELSARPVVPPVDPEDTTGQPEDSTAVAPWSLGDLNGDGRLTREDRQLLARLMQGNDKDVTAYHIRAGDYNGNGRLDNGDYQLLTEDFRARGVIN